MKAKEFIEIVRAELKELYDMHKLSIDSQGQYGLRCLNPEVLEMQMNRTDEEILKHYIAEGAQIEDADDYMSSLHINK